MKLNFWFIEYLHILNIHWLIGFLYMVNPTFYSKIIYYSNVYKIKWHCRSYFKYFQLLGLRKVRCRQVTKQYCRGGRRAAAAGTSWPTFSAPSRIRDEGALECTACWGLLSRTTKYCCLLPKLSLPAISRLQLLRLMIKVAPIDSSVVLVRHINTAL